MSAARVDLYLGYASQVFKWARKNYRNNVTINPFEGLQLGKKARKRPDKQRYAFTADDLKKLFIDSDYFGQDNWGRANHPHFFWIPLLGLYTGAREEELGQLYVDDVKQIEGVWVLDINDSRPDQSVKTDEQRLIPLHDFIVQDLKFIEYVQSLPQDGRLFPKLKRIQHRYTHSFTQWFGRFKKRCDIADNKTFHSFRHTLTTKLIERDVEEYRVSWLVGHVVEGQTTGRYGKKFYAWHKSCRTKAVGQQKMVCRPRRHDQDGGPPLRAAHRNLRGHGYAETVKPGAPVQRGRTKAGIDNRRRRFPRPRHLRRIDTL